MTSGPNPAISGTAIGEALGVNAHGTGNPGDVSDEQVALDKAELRELEHDEYAPVLSSHEVPPPAAAEAPRSFLQRLFRR